MTDKPQSKFTERLERIEERFLGKQNKTGATVYCTDADIHTLLEAVRLLRAGMKRIYDNVDGKNDLESSESIAGTVLEQLERLA